MTENEALVEAMNMIASGEADIMGGFLYGEELKSYVQYPQESYGVVYTTLSVLEGNSELTETSYAIADTLKVAVIDGADKRISEMDKFLKNTGVNYELVKCDDVDEQYNALVEERADALLRVSLSYIPGTKEITQFSPRPYYLVTSPRNDEICAQIDNAINSINSAYPYLTTKLFNEYFGDTSGKFTVTDEENTFIKDKKELNVLCIDNSAPFVFRDNNGNLCGIAVSIMNDFAKQTGLKINYDVYDFSEEFVDKLYSDDYDCVLGVPVNNDYNTELGILTSNSYMSVDTVVYMNKKGSNKSLRNSSVALQKGSELADKLDADKIVFYDTIEECIKAVSTQKVDRGYGNARCVEFYMNMNYINLTVVPVADMEQAMEISILKKNDNTLLKLINRYTNNIQETELYNYAYMVNKYIDNDSIFIYAKAHPIEFIIIMVIFITVTFTVVLLLFVTKEMHKKNLLLETANSSKSEFLSRMSHDMRTPMNGIIGITNIIMDQPGNSHKLNEALLKIKNSSDYLMSLINDTLDMNKIESNNLILNYEPVNFNKLLDDIISIIKVNAEEKNISLIVENNNSEDYTFSLDRMRVEQIILNIVSNAVKFTNENGKIEVIINSQLLKENVIQEEIIIKDNGVGISKEFLPTLFDAFTQEDATVTSNYGGTGLGMSIVKKLVELMNGTIKVESEKNVGTAFKVSIPFKKSDIDEVTAKQVKYKYDDNLLAGKRVLLAEDHPLNTEIAIMLLQKKEIIAETAVNGEEAVRLFSDSEMGYFDGILMDIRMPVMDGITAAKKIRSMDRKDAASIPIIAMTANAFAEDITNTREAGMNAHLAKPIEPEKFYQTLTELFYK